MINLVGLATDWVEAIADARDDPETRPAGYAEPHYTVSPKVGVSRDRGFYVYHVSEVVTEVNSECYAALRLLSDLAQLSGQEADAARFRAEAEQLKDHINQHLINPKNGLYVRNIDLRAHPASHRLPGRPSPAGTFIRCPRRKRLGAPAVLRRLWRASVSLRSRFRKRKKPSQRCKTDRRAENRKLTEGNITFVLQQSQ